MITASAAATASAFAVDVETVEKSIPLKDGLTVYLLLDGRMTVERWFGRAVRMKEGEATKQGGRSWA